MNPVRLSRSRARIVWGRRNLFLAASAVLWGLSGCTLPDDGEPGEPGEPPGDSQGRQVRTTFQVTLGDYEAPTGVFLSLDEAPNAAGLFDGSLTLSSSGRATSVRVAATLDGERELTVAAGALGSVHWDELRIDLRDTDGDDVFESGSGRIEGRLVSYSGEDPFVRDFQAAPDAFRALATARPEGNFSGTLLPWQPLMIELGQPVQVEHISSYVVLADGQPIWGQTQLLEYDPYHSYTAVRFLPEIFYPLGAEITIETLDMENTLGTAVESDPTPILVIADPGLASDNLGFEQALAGWSAVGTVTTEASYGGVVPGEGAAMAVLQTGGLAGAGDTRLVGYFDVPADASELDLSLEVLAGERLPAAVTVRLYRDDYLFELDAFEVYEFVHEAENFVPCDCADLDLTRRTGAFRRQVSLAGFRGERVFIELRVDGGERLPSSPPDVRALGVRPIPPPPPPAPAALVVDDIQIR